MKVAVKLRGSLNDWRTRTRAGRSKGASPGETSCRTGGRPEAGDTWKFALCRYDYCVDFEGPELSTARRCKRPAFTASKTTPR